MSKQDIDDMSRLISIMNGNSTVSENSSSENDGVSAMKAILERFHRSTDTLIGETDIDMPLREAMLMQETDDGVIMGVWEIRTKTESGRKLYDVVNINEENPIAVDLTIYEAARGLVQALNDGLPINSTFIRDLLQNEGEHANAVHDAIHAKYTLQKNSLSEDRRALLEDKYGVAFRRASDARRRVLQIVERYPYNAG